ncbi:hypothetical protein HYZ64_00130 [Candidatus Berkelbacteria bacterium]|nr:hypothetical protein [Candidatus Berkelbacteria bacterium]
MVIAEVVPLVHLNADRNLLYSIPPEILPDLQVGSLVRVPLRARRVQGVVVGFKRATKLKTMKPIERIEMAVCVDSETFRLAQFLRTYYYAQLGECLNAILPS